MRKLRGFTLIELLIVVAIIAILAAIAVPNFLEAQVRSKVSRVRSDHRSLATALEAYAVDYNKYPRERGNMNNPASYIPLSTPVSYIANPWINDPFKYHGMPSSNPGWNDLPKVYAYSDLHNPTARAQKFTRDHAFPLVEGHDIKSNNPSGRDPKHLKWYLISYGPDKILNADNDPLNTANIADNVYMPYDSTNGTNSVGDIWRVGP